MPRASGRMPPTGGKPHAHTTPANRRCRRTARHYACYARRRRPSTCENRTGTPIPAPPRSRRRPHGWPPAESVVRGGARGGLAARSRRRLVALARRCRGGWSGKPLQTLESTILRTHGLAEAWKSWAVSTISTRNNIGREGRGGNAARSVSKMSAVVGLSCGMARPVRKLRCESRLERPCGK
jgi:hypothetical protein